MISFQSLDYDHKVLASDQLSNDGEVEVSDSDNINDDFSDLLDSLSGDAEYESVDSGPTSSTPNSISQDRLIVRKQRRNRKSLYSPVPKLLKSDIRKLYSTMFVNVINNMDCSLTNSFFSTFCSADVCYSLGNSADLSDLFSTTNPNNAKVTRVTGASHASQVLHNGLMEFPDFVLRLKDAKLHVSQSGTSYIESNFEMSTTVLHDTSSWSDRVYLEDEKDTIDNTANKRVKNNFIDGIGGESFTFEAESYDGKKGVQICYSYEQHQALINSSPLLETPIKYAVEGTLKMLIDDNKRLTKIEMMSTKLAPV